MENIMSKQDYCTEEVAIMVCAKSGHKLLMFANSSGPFAMCTNCGLRLDEIRAGKMQSELSLIQ
jgi:hypothetical protein